MLSITSLVKRRGEREILRGVGMQLARGEVGVLIGASGSGKSTVLRCVNGLETFDEGEIVVGAAKLTAGNHRGRAAELAAVRRNAGMVFQQFNLFTHLSVIENVIEAPVGVLRKTRAEAVDDAVSLLDRVGMKDRLQAMPHQLSGGQQQRVAIARALAVRPELILFDEPTSALDPKMTGEVLAVMGDLAKSGQSMLVVTHSMTFARKVGTAIHVLSQGRIVESGPPEKIFDHPEHNATRELLHQVAAT